MRGRKISIIIIVGTHAHAPSIVLARTIQMTQAVPRCWCGVESSCSALQNVTNRAGDDRAHEHEACLACHAQYVRFCDW